MADEVDAREQHFHNRVRESIICFLLFTTLYIVSYVTITRYKKKADFISDDDEDAMVNRISLWLCTFTLAMSLGAVLLLPFSIVSNEVLLSFPQSYYMQWLNGSLIHGLWNLIFLFSNLSLVFLMPFAYFFTESEGFSGSRKGIAARLYETLVVLFLLSLLVAGMVWVASALIDDDAASKESLYDFWEFYLPYLYSCISLFGVLLLLLCTPLGLSCMFSVTGQLLVKPRLLEDLDEQIDCQRFEEDTIKRRLNGTACQWVKVDQQELAQALSVITMERTKLETRRRASPWQRNLGYPLVMLLLLTLTGVSVLIVSIHILELLFDETAMPKGAQERGLGKASLSALGSVGAAIEVVLIFYLMLSSVLGFYSLPTFMPLTPKSQDTPMTKIIGNCVSLLILSSALPVLSRTLGITNFDLLGDYGRFNWLGNFYIVLLYNLLFAGLTTLCLVTKFTAAVRQELFKALGLDRLPITASDGSGQRHSTNGHSKQL
ncbi:protein LMBR1L-like [Lethenteron reissneri]|uniref:protein LMBR1L-like n=1 Tax=Lethenteron reissneri TaxID=7753 RepID=UPI002AB60D76|nr:protein LMBR1L-like [Lethenteron reissneri]XP_061432640.1 protein LMBR1L-like [Lethenteron reissneri]